MIPATVNASSPGAQTASALSPSLQAALLDLGRLAQAHGATVALKGGTAANFYVQAALTSILPAAALDLRLVSNDIDWVCANNSHTIARHLTLIELMGSARPIVAAPIESIYGMKFGSTIARGSTNRMGESVDLDLIPVCRIAPKSDGAMFEFGFYPSRENAATAWLEQRFPGLSLNSREIIIAEKLTLGRGSEVGKFDLVDATLLLITAPVNQEIVSGLVAGQRYATEIDLGMQLTNPIKQNGLQVGLLSETQLELLNRVWTGLELSGLQNNSELHTFKSLSLACRLLASLEKIQSSDLARYISADQVKAAGLEAKLAQGQQDFISGVLQAFRLTS